MTKLADAMRAKFKTPAAAVAALGIDPEVLREPEMTGDQAMAFDTNARRRFAFDAEEEREEMRRDCRDRIRRALDEGEFDPAEVIEALATAYPAEVGQAAREIGEDVARGRGPHSWARDRRMTRRARNSLHLRAGRDTGRRPAVVRDDPPPFVGRPEPGGTTGHRDEDRPIENFSERGTRWEEGLDRRRQAADALAFDRGDLGASWFGEGFASIETR